MIRARHIGAAFALSVLALAGCSQGTTAAAPATSAPPPSPQSAPTAAVPTEFASGDVRIALVRQLSSGDYFEQWLAGAEAEAKALNVRLEISSGDGNNDKQALNLEQAVNQKADAIIVDHGFAQTVQPAVKKAADAGIPLVAFDVDPGTPKAVVLSQDDHQIAEQALGALKADTGGSGEVVYVYVAGFAPLDRRDETWTQFKKDNPGIKQVAQIGVVNSSTASAVADQAKAALQANPDVKAIFAPYDEFAKGATLAIKELGLQDKIKVYGADISTADIGVMTEPNSPWVATSTTDPSNVGRVAVRAAALLVAGEKVGPELKVPPALVTQRQLRDGAITNIEQLTQAIPALNTPDVARVPWAAS
ncbi:substrate-binding domain-containing protein [Nonomuraea cavernae]|uniref:Sugar ABC transporter substrate-binding protein n=1 Tax=Nonomuraea cavernae TaxID=2045107 RepID=A0A917Z2L6_9ACTN|nr:substrate-binding domain-containing protein [Nonomuraea cavernae]MCA2188053.1 substrate-binding domain-containing protein [Nonomuraea cavernae]GGO72673.1 sugar ABC transporter substrate-binding protein [Nonomuraea cavernae]